ncbi:MAG TPA: TolC family protein [Clostridia bacterium]|nr:TolC family protein [Clostridia bacterium]
MHRNVALVIVISLSWWAWPQNGVVSASSGSPPTQSPISLTLDDAIRLAKANAPQFRAALTESRLAREERVQAQAAMLPNASFTTGAIYTQPNGTPTGAFVGANSVREYVSQGLVHEGLSFSSVADFRRARSMEALARAKAEVAIRGLVTTVVKDFYVVVVAARKVHNAQLASEEARRFVNLSQQLERGGEVAHSDVIKAQLQSNERERDVQEARLAEQKARLELAVLIFPNFLREYQLVDDLRQLPTLPEFAHVQNLASHNNPDLTAAVAALRASQQEVNAAIGGHLPSLSLNYFYGIDANQYATRAPDGVRNLGYQISATLELPIFNWGVTQSKVRQAQLRHDQARVELSAAQRQALANLQQFYDEAQTARSQIDLLRQSAELAEESLRLTRLRYRDGEATALESVDAQNMLVQARNNYDDGSVRYRVAIASLQTLTGSF